MVRFESISAAGIYPSKRPTSIVNAARALVLLVASFLGSSLVQRCEGHGYMSSPRSRNWYAAQEGTWGSELGKPRKESCPHCLNGNDNVCGTCPSCLKYDAFVDSTGLPMPWTTQETYEAGQEITVRSTLTAHHYGHMEIAACALGPDSDPDCFADPKNALKFVRDSLYDMPRDPSYPERGYYAADQKDYEMVFKLPDNLSGVQVMLQWKYITANSCSPPGYADYFNGNNDNGVALPSKHWSSGVRTCTPPYPNDGSRAEGFPEQFFNCAEVTISPSNPTISPAPTTPATPLPTRTPTLSPPPTISPPQCIEHWGDCSNDRTGCCSDLQCTEYAIGMYECVVPGNPPSPTSPVATPNPTPSPTHSQPQRECAVGYTGLVATGDCTHYYHCVGGVKTGDNLPCPSGTLFSKALQVCDWNYNVKCSGSMTKALYPANPPTPNPTPPPNAASCPEGYIGLRPINGCTQYHHCVDGVVTSPDYACSLGYLFNFDRQYCDYD